jgi:hypothetical protein
MYLEYLEDPSAFKPRRTVRIPRKSPDSSPPADRTRQPTGHEPSADLVLFSFPVRPGVLAELHLPPDLTDAETRRLSAFVTALAIDQPVSD